MNLVRIWASVSKVCLIDFRTKKTTKNTEIKYKINCTKENINAYVQGPLAFDNAVSPEAAKIKKITNDVAGKADILLVPNLETGNALSKIMVYFMGACAAGFIVGGKVPVVVTSRADNSASRIASIAASIIAAQ